MSAKAFPLNHAYTIPSPKYPAANHPLGAAPTCPLPISYFPQPDSTALIHGHFIVPNTAPMYSVTHKPARSDDYGFVVSFNNLTDSNFTCNILSLWQHHYQSTQKPPAPHVQRTPLADISMDPTRVLRQAIKLALVFPKTPNSGVEAFVINAINFTEKNVPSVEGIPEHATPTIVASRGENLGSLTAQPSPSPSTAFLTHMHISESTPTPSDVSFLFPFKDQTQSSPSHDTLSTPTPRPHLRAQAHTTSSPSFIRVDTLDLHSLISFFGGHVSAIDIDVFNTHTKEGMMKALAKRIKEKDAAVTLADVHWWLSSTSIWVCSDTATIASRRCCDDKTEQPLPGNGIEIALP
ncbi:hypothetical protein BDR07DRAFT_1477898 [Suillus spraguei]|nr:hypothetical protein BDR07DRAFT_1477898 [Suillus spraguei]